MHWYEIPNYAGLVVPIAAVIAFLYILYPLS